MRTPWPDGGSHQCCTSPSTNCRAAARRRCCARQRRLRHRERHHVLELVAEAVGAARLVERRARPDPAGERLVEQPAVQQDVHGAIGRPHLHRAEDVVPVRGHRAQDRVEVGGAVARDQRLRLGSRRRLAEQEDDLGRAVRLELERRLQGAAGIETGADSIGERRASAQRGRSSERAVAAEELRPVAGPCELPSRRGRQTRRGRRTRCSRGCAPASRRSPDRSRSRRTAPRRRATCRAPTPRTR